MKQTRKRSYEKLQTEKYCCNITLKVHKIFRGREVNAKVIHSTLWNPQAVFGVHCPCFKVLPKKPHVADMCYSDKRGFQEKNSCILVFLIGDFCHTLVFLFDCQRIWKKSAYQSSHMLAQQKYASKWVMAARTGKPQRRITCVKVPDTRWYVLKGTPQWKIDVISFL